jgi:hypothetical protein
MTKKSNYKKKFVEVVDKLLKEYPEVSLGRHLDTALADYGVLCNYSEKELCYAIEKYHNELDMDLQHIVPDDYVDKIVEDAKHLFDNKEDEEIEDGY